MTTPASALFMRLGDDARLFPVPSVERASEMYCAARDASGDGASRVPPALIVDQTGQRVACISYNGRIWPGSDAPEMWRGWR